MKHQRRSPEHIALVRAKAAHARAAKLTPARRREIARLGALEKWRRWEALEIA